MCVCVCVRVCLFVGMSLGKPLPPAPPLTGKQGGGWRGRFLPIFCIEQVVVSWGAKHHVGVTSHHACSPRSLLFPKGRFKKPVARYLAASVQMHGATAWTLGDPLSRSNCYSGSA